MFTYRTGQSNFQLIVESNLDLLWFCLASAVIGVKTRSEPIIRQTKTNQDLVSRAFPRIW